MRRLAAILSGWVFVVACGGEKKAPAPPPPREIEVLTMAPTEVRDTSDYLGSLLSRESVTVLPQVAGYVRKIHVKPGQKVEAGALLLEVDSRQEAAAVDSAQAQASAAQARLALAQQTAARSEALFKEGLASAQELDRARADMQAAQAAARAAQADVSQRQVQLQYNVIRAAVPGTIGDVMVRLGDYVNANTQLTTIAQADVLELSVMVPAVRARAITNETPVEVLDDGGRVLLRSNAFFVAPQADPRTQLVEVKAIFQNSVGLRPAELVRTRIVYATRQALQLPALAVVRQSGQPFAFVLTQKDQKTVVERRPVTLGALGEAAYVVEGGLKPGDRIAVSSLQALRDGTAVKVKGAAARADAVDSSTVTPAQ